MTIQNKTPFELEAPTSDAVSARIEAPKPAQVEREGRVENCIERHREKAAFAFRLTAVHFARTGECIAAGGPQGSRSARKSAGNAEEGLPPNH